jgi:hypothetical protein
MRILITGDSWGCGEWDGLNVDYRVTHSGIEQYLRDDGYDVKNISVGGNNNLQSLELAKSESFDHLIFFFTDPLRQATFEEFSTLSPKQIAQEHTDYVCSNLKYFPKVTLIGGCVKVNPKENIDYVIPSVSELVVPKFKDTPYMTSHEWEEHWMNVKKPSSQFKQEILDITEQTGPKYQLWKDNPDLFWPDGLHANRKAIRIVYDHLLSLWSMS